MGRRRKRKQRQRSGKPDREPVSRGSVQTTKAEHSPPSPAEAGAFSAVLARLDEQKSALEKLAYNKVKDGWDKLSVVATLISSVLIATVGLVFTFMYQTAESENRSLVREEQNHQEAERGKVRQLELVAKLLPSLGSDDQDTRKQAFLTINALGETELMTLLAIDSPSDGARAALQAVAVSPQSSAADKARANEALEQIREWDTAIVKSASTAVVQINAASDRSQTTMSGFLWRSPDFVVTSMHSLIGAANITVTFSFEGKRAIRRAHVHRVLRDADLVLLKLESPMDLQPREIGEIHESITERVITIGYPSGVRAPLSSWLNLRAVGGKKLGDLLPPDSRKVIGELGFPSLDSSVIPLEGSLVPGHQGAPVIDVAGRVVGIVSGGLPKTDIGWAVPADQLSMLLESKDEVPAKAAVEELF